MLLMTLIARVKDVADIVLEYIGTRLAQNLLSGLFRSECESHGRNLSFAMASSFNKCAPDPLHSVVYYQRTLRVAALTYDLTNFIFAHLENVNLANACRTSGLRKITEAVQQVSMTSKGDLESSFAKLSTQRVRGKFWLAQRQLDHTLLHNR